MPNAPDIANNNTDKEVAVSIDGWILKYAITPRMAPSSATTKPSKAIEPIADAETLPILLKIANAPDIANNKVDSDTAVGINVSVGIPDKTYKIPASNPIATEIANIEPIAPLKFEAIFSTKANIPITIDKASVAAASFPVSINDNAAIEAAINPIATVIAIMLPLQSCAPFVAYIIAVIIADNRPTAVMPFASPPRSIRLRIMATPAKIPIDKDIASKVAATPLRLFPPASRVAAIRPVTIPPNKVMHTTPLAISLGSIFATILIVSAINIIAADTPIIAEPILPTFFPMSLVAAISPVINPPNNVIQITPFVISEGSNPETTFITPTVNNIAADTLRITLPKLFTSFPANLVAAISPVISPPNSVIQTIPFVILVGSSLDIAFIVSVINIIAADILISIEPALLMSLAPAPFVSFPRAKRIAASPVIIAVNPPNTGAILSSFRNSSFFIADAITYNDAVTPTSTSDNLLKPPPETSILLTANDKTPNIAAKAPNAPIAPQSLPVSNCASA